MIDTVFLDVDDVLADFMDGIHKTLNIPYNYKIYPYKKGDWNILGYQTKLNDGSLVTFEKCNACCTTLFWQHLEWMHDGHDILKEVIKYFKPEQIYLLTSPMPNVESATGKWIWVKKNLPKYYKQTIITQAPKSLLAKPDCLLIDDKDENVEEFIAAGGDAILVPRPWNKLYKDKDCAWFTVATELVKKMNGCKLR